MKDSFTLKKEIEEWSQKANAVIAAMGEVVLAQRSEELTAQMSEPGFWDDSEKAQVISQEAAEIAKDIEAIDATREFITGLPELFAMAEEDSSLEEGLRAEFEKAQRLLRELELKTYFTDEHDEAPALVSFAAGAGGVDAMDWAEKLMRMYIRYAESKEWKVELLESSMGEEAGIKSATIRIRGRFAYGMLKGEAGVHRLVRISPFDAEGMRHTSFAAVEVIPELTDVKENNIQIDPEDLRIDTYMSSGKGGQSVNTTYSAIRITHIPTGTVVTCQNERSQQQNKESAMKVLKSRLYKLMLEERKEKIEELRGTRKSIEWGSQIRSYVMQPYQLVKDHRTNVETADISGVLDGKIENFIEGYLQKEAKK